MRAWNSKDLTGQRFGRLTVLGYDHTEKGRAYWKCRCDCGNETVVAGGNLISGHSQSCGCLQKAASTTHGMHDSKIYWVWCEIKKRCFNPNNKSYKNYGERGITMCDEWRDNFQAFYDYVSQLEHFGEDGYSLDRIDNNGSYVPGNLRWADRKTQNRNRRNSVIVEYEGAKMTLVEAAEKSGIAYDALQTRVYRGWPAECLFAPVFKWN